MRSQPVSARTGVSVRESAVAAGADQVSIATFNVENLAGNEPEAKYDALAGMIVNNLAAPDIVGLEEIQDNNGATDDGTVVDATTTLNRLVAAISAAGGPAYSYRQINPVDAPGRRCAGRQHPRRLPLPDRPRPRVRRSPGRRLDDAVSVVAGPNGPELSASPGRVAPTNTAWNASRKPLAAEFTYNGHKLFVIVNHFNSKGGDQGLFGPQQPPVLSSEVQRNQQATLLAGFVDDILAPDPTANIAVVGDLNDFQFSPPVQKLKDAGLTALIETLPPSGALQLRLRRQQPGARPHHGQRQPDEQRRGRGGLRHRARELGVHRPGLRPRSAARPAHAADADDLGVRLARRRTPPAGTTAP